MPNETTKKTKSAPKLSLVGLIFLLPFIAVYFATKSHYSKNQIAVNGTAIHVEIATSLQEKSRGLCCRNSLPENSGMLFIYDKSGVYHYWMKDTLIPLDMYWISSEKKIVHIEENVQPNSYPESFGTDTASQYVLETNAGFAKKHNIKVGDSASF